jgi:hypothetical protein
MGINSVNVNFVNFNFGKNNFIYDIFVNFIGSLNMHINFHAHFTVNFRSSFIEPQISAVKLYNFFCLGRWHLCS